MPSKGWDALLEDAAGSDGGSFDPLPAADYPMVVEDAKATQTKTGKLMYKLTCVVQGGPHDKRKVWANMVVSPESSTAMSIFFRQMTALGLTREYFRQNPQDDQVAQHLVGRQFRATVGQREWQGNTQNEIKAYNAAGGPGSPGGSVPSAPSVSAPAAQTAPVAPPAAPPIAPPPPPSF